MSEHVNVSDAALADIEARLVEARCGSHELNLMIGVIAEKFDDREYTVAEGCKRLASPYTRSLDAAVSLAERVLPKSQHVVAGPWIYAKHHKNAGQKVWEASIVYRHNLYEELIHDKLSRGATPALALCLAIIRALRASPKREFA